MNRPLIAIPMGDPAGIGPEITIRTMANSQTIQSARCVVIGSRKALEQALRFPNMPNMTIRVIDTPQQGNYQLNVLNLIDLDNIDMDRLTLGQVSDMCGRAAYEYIERAVALAMSGAVDAVTTTCINKESLKAAGVPYIGHTEIFGALTGSYDPLTMFEVRGMRVFFLSRHMSLRQACDSVKKERIVEYVQRCTQELKRLGITKGTMAIAGLNPHCGEHGLFGDEEVREVTPAVEKLTALGYNMAGPIGADSVFYQTLQGKYSSVLSLYHDQGHIATKTVDFHRTISLTLGMPILRTSVDHGTAFDVAGKGLASSVSLEEAVQVAAKYAPNFVREQKAP